jgi:archaellum component FlaG (FlaF/FlaG flagellin family)
MLNYKNKKGFGDAVSTLILFIAVISVSVGLVIAFQNYVVKTQSSFKSQNDRTVNQLKSEISITNIYYNSSSNTSYIYVKNIGEIKLIPTEFDLFVDGAFTKNFSVFYADNLSKSITLFQPGETLAIVYNKYLSPGTHKIRVVTEYSTYDEDFFNI